jgi:hypothetical protein
LAFSNWITKIENDLSYLEDYCIKVDDNDSSKQTVIDLYKVFNFKTANNNIFNASDILKNNFLVFT